MGNIKVILILLFTGLSCLFAQSYPFSVLVNSTTAGHQDSPEIAVNSKGTILTVFESYYSGGDDDENIFAVSYDRKTFKEFHYTGKKTDTPSLEAFPNSDKFFVSWEQSTEVYYAIVSCKDNVEEFVEGPETINIGSSRNGKSPDIAISNDGNLVAVAWQHYSNDDVVFQVLDSNGIALTNVIDISDVSKRRSQIGVKFRSDSSLVLTWHTKVNQTNGEDEDIWFQLYDCKDVYTGGDPVKLFDTEKRANGNLDLEYANFRQEYPEVDVFDDGRFVIMWQDFPNNGGQDGTDEDSKGAYFRIFNQDGTPQTEDIQVAEHTYGFQKDAAIRIRKSDKTIHFIYEDAYESSLAKDWLAYPVYRVFNDSGIPIDAAIELSDKSYGTDCRLAITEGDAEEPNLVLGIWESKDIENYDDSGRAIIYRDITAIITDIDRYINSDIVIEQFELAQNYPNPFNPRTNIRFMINTNGNVLLDIYDVLGHKVRTLVNRNMQVGSYHVVWNGTNNHGQIVSNGIYFYKLQMGSKIETKKMMYLK